MIVWINRDPYHMQCIITGAYQTENEPRPAGVLPYQVVTAYLEAKWSGSEMDHINLLDSVHKGIISGLYAQRKTSH